jgi:hypothetical protein
MKQFSDVSLWSEYILINHKLEANFHNFKQDVCRILARTAQALSAPPPNTHTQRPNGKVTKLVVNVRPAQC